MELIYSSDPLLAAITHKLEAGRVTEEDPSTPGQDSSFFQAVMFYYNKH